MYIDDEILGGSRPVEPNHARILLGLEPGHRNYATDQAVITWYENRGGGSFMTALFECMVKADLDNLARLGKAFPGETCSFIMWRLMGIDFLKRNVSGTPEVNLNG